MPGLAPPLPPRVARRRRRRRPDRLERRRPAGRRLRTDRRAPAVGRLGRGARSASRLRAARDVEDAGRRRDDGDRGNLCRRGWPAGGRRRHALRGAVCGPGARRRRRLRRRRSAPARRRHGSRLQAVMTGFLFGLGLTVAIGQLPKLFGVEGGTGKFFQQALVAARRPRRDARLDVRRRRRQRRAARAAASRCPASSTAASRHRFGRLDALLVRLDGRAHRPRPLAAVPYRRGPRRGTRPRRAAPGQARGAQGPVVGGSEEVRRPAAQRSRDHRVPGARVRRGPGLVTTSSASRRSSGSPPRHRPRGRTSSASSS